MDVGTSEQGLGLSHQQTQAGEEGNSGPQAKIAPDKKSKVGPGPEAGQGKNENLSPAPGGVTGGHLQLSPEPPKRPKSPLMAQYKDLRKTALVDRCPRHRVGVENKEASL